MKPELSKKINDPNGEIIVRAMDIKEVDNKEGQWIVEVVTQGCMVCSWVVRKVDKSYFVAELNEVHDRLTSIKTEADNLVEAIRVGRKLADIIIDFYFN